MYVCMYVCSCTHARARARAHTYAGAHAYTPTHPPTHARTHAPHSLSLTTRLHAYRLLKVLPRPPDAAEVDVLCAGRVLAATPSL